MFGVQYGKSTIVHVCTICFEPDFYTVESSNKGHFGENKNSAVVSFVERLSALFGGSNVLEL